MDRDGITAVTVSFADGTARTFNPPDGAFLRIADTYHRGKGESYPPESRTVTYAVRWSEPWPVTGDEEQCLWPEV